MPWRKADLWIPPAATPGYMAARRIGIASQPCPASQYGSGLQGGAFNGRLTPRKSVKRRQVELSAKNGCNKLLFGGLVRVVMWSIGGAIWR